MNAPGNIDGEDGRLGENIAYFARALRVAGLPIGPGMVIDAVRGIEASGIGDKQDFYWTLHALLVRKHEHSPLFDQAFRLFWKKRGYLERLMAMMLPAMEDPRQRKAETAMRRVQDALFSAIRDQQKPKKPRLDIDATFTVSDAEILQRKDFEQMSAEELALAAKAISRLRLSVDEQVTRRLKPAVRGRLIDPRRTLRASLRAGGALIDLKRRDHGIRRPPIVALCDISGSMSQYTRIFLHFLHALSADRGQVHSFLFGTRLTNITRSLRHKDVDEAIASCSAAVPDWSGGTRIATSLHQFNRHWSRRVLGQGAIVLLVSDGLERDDHGLDEEMARLHRSCRRLIWLNPLLRYDGFEPRARGIRAMLAHVDEFRPVHDLTSIADLVQALSRPVDQAIDMRDWRQRAA